MNKIGRPTHEEINRIEELADKYFEEDIPWAVESKFWDDGDVHLEAYQTLGTGADRGYNGDVNNHRNIIYYRRDDGFAKYVERVQYNHTSAVGYSVSVLEEERLDF